MEPFSKRRRLSRREGRRSEDNDSRRLKDAASSNTSTNDNEGQNIGNSVEAESHAAPNDIEKPIDKVEYPSKISRHAEGRREHIRPRHLVPRHALEVVQPVATTVASVIRVIIDNPAGSTIGDVLVPAESSVFSFQGSGPITLGAGPKPSSSPVHPPVTHDFVTESNTATSNFQEVKPTPQPVPRPSEQPSASGSASMSSVASQNLLTINVPGSSSQALLSSPPSTPPPSSPSSSSLSPATMPTGSSGSTGSYFSLPSEASSVSSSTQISPIPTPPQISNVPHFPAPTGGNFSTTFSSSSETSTGSEMQSSLTFATPILNSTLITSTRTHSSTSSRHTTSSSLTFSSGSVLNATMTSSQSSTQSSSFTTSSASSTAIVAGGGGGAAGTSTTTGTAPSSAATSGAASGASSTPSTPVVVGGVVGGVAGLTVVLLLILFLLRWRRNKMQDQRVISPPMAQTNPSTGAPSGTVTERSSGVPFATAGFFRRMRPHSSHTAATTDTAPSERGFQNLGGRKIESVLSSRGDGYGNPGPSSPVRPSSHPSPVNPFLGGTAAGLRPASPQTPLSETSFYRDSQGFYGGSPPDHERDLDPSMSAGRTSSQLTSPTYANPVSLVPPPRSAARNGGPSQGDQEVVVMRPGPARTPVTNQADFAALRQPPRSTPPAPPARSAARDGVGRSHPSFDGSRGSRFTEEMAPP